MKRMTWKIVYAIILVASVLMAYAPDAVKAQGVDYQELEEQAEKYYREKDYNRAVAIWLNILDNDPENVRIQKRIEDIYELKQEKSIELQKAKLYYKITRKRFAQEQLKEGVSSGTQAINSFIIAYRIDPRDPEMKELLVDMRELEKEIDAAKEKIRVSEVMRRRYEELKAQALLFMEEEQYEDALKNWNKILRFLPKDVDALEGKRKCRLAIDNRLKFEKIRNYLARGKGLYENKDYQLAKIEFDQVLKIDPSNREAKNYIKDIDEKLEEIRLFEQRAQQAEDFYVSGKSNIRKENFDQAEEDFESALALIDGYKDARKLLNSIDRLRKEYIEREKARKMETINKEFQDGMLALSDGRFVDAIAAFSKTLYLDPGNKQARKYLAQAKDAQKQIEEEQVDSNSPYYDIVNALAASGSDLYRKGKYRESMEMWDRILELFPKNRNANVNRLRCFLKINPSAYDRLTKSTIADGRTLLKKKDFSDALKKFELIKSISPRYAGIDSLIAQAKRGLSVGKTAELSTSEKSTVAVMYKRALALYSRGGGKNYRKAAELLRDVVDKDPGNTKAIISLNKIEVQLRGVGVERVSAGRALSEEQKQRVRKHYYTGINYYSRNDYTKAISEWRKVLAIDPNHIKAKNNIRKTLVFLGR